MNIKSIAALFLFSFFGVWAAAQDTAVRWETNFDLATQKAEQTNRPLFVHFVGDNCQPVIQMDNEVFTNPAVIACLNTDFIPVRINTAEQQNLTQRYSVQAIPTDLITKSNGQLLHRRQGGISGERFGRYLAFVKNTVLKPAAPPYSSVAAASPAPAQAPASNNIAYSSAPTQTPFTVPVREQAPAVAEPLHDPFPKTTIQPNPIRVGADNNAPPASFGTTKPILAESAPVQTVPAQNVALASSAPPTSQPNFNNSYNVSNPVSVKVPLSEVVEMPKKTVEVPLALEGFCPVSLNVAISLDAKEIWIPGNPAFYTMYQGYIFRFASAEALNAFTGAPEKYVPAAMGEDVVLLIDRNKRVSGNHKFGAWFHDRVFLFASQETLSAFADRPDFYTEIAIKYETANKDRHLPIAY